MDVHKIGMFDSSGRFASLLDLNDGSAISFVRDTFKVTPYSEQALYPDASRRYGGSRQIGETHGNGQIEATWLLYGGTADATLAVFDGLVKWLESSRQDLFYLWRPEGASKNTYYDLRGGLPWEPLYQWTEFSGAKVLQVSAGWQVAPVSQGDRMDILDDFSTDTVTAGDWTFDSGAGEVAVAGGKLTALNTNTKRFHHSAKGYLYQDVQVTVKRRTGGAVTGITDGPVLKRISASRYLEVDQSSGGINIRSDSTVFASTLIAATVNTDYWIRGRIEGNVVTGELWTSAPTPLGTPAATVTYTLTGADATNYGAAVAGAPGVIWFVDNTSETIDDFTVEPYTYNRKGTQTVAAHVIDLPGIPGTAPALVDAKTIVPGRAKFGLIGWAQTKGVANLVRNGSFEVGTNGWATTGSAYLVNGGLIAQDATTFFKGTQSGKITSLAASSNTGAHYIVYRRFRKGQTYTLAITYKASAATWAMGVGDLTGADVGGVIAAASASGYTTQLVTWTPTADRDAADVYVRNSSTTSGIINIDAVQVYEGTTPPTGTQLEGMGALTPFGLVEAEATLGATITANAGSSGGNYSNATNLLFDLSLIEPDDFSNTIALEVWAIGFAGGPGTATVLTTAAAVISPILPTTDTVYTSEYGSAAHTFLTPSGRTLTRAGTLVLPVSGLWQVVVTAGGVLTGIDALMIVPARQRACNSTGKNSTDVEELVPSGTGETVKTIKSDLSGTIADALTPDVTGGSTGLSGQLLEFPAGDIKVLHHVGNNVVDTPDTQNGGQAIATSSMAVHYAITPRYHLARSG